MKRSIISSALVAALLLSGGLSIAADKTPAAAGDMKTIKNTGKTQKSPEAKKAAANIKLVDINSASKTELTKLPGISEAEADQIIAGRPYLTKAHLVTRNIISAGAYESLKKRIVARQKESPTAIPVRKSK